MTSPPLPVLYMWLRLCMTSPPPPCTVHVAETMYDISSPPCTVHVRLCMTSPPLPVLYMWLRLCMTSPPLPVLYMWLRLCMTSPPLPVLYMWLRHCHWLQLTVIPCTRHRLEGCGHVFYKTRDEVYMTSSTSIVYLTRSGRNLHRMLLIGQIHEMRL